MNELQEHIPIPPITIQQPAGETVDTEQEVEVDVTQSEQR